MATADDSMQGRLKTRVLPLTESRADPMIKASQATTSLARSTARSQRVHRPTLDASQPPPYGMRLAHDRAHHKHERKNARITAE